MNFLSRIFRRGLSCHQVEAVLQQYLDEELDAADVPKVLKHLEACRDCGLEADLYSQIKTSLHAHQEAPDDASILRIHELAQALATTGLPDRDY